MIYRGYRPTSPVAGDMWVEPPKASGDLPAVYLYTGREWVEIGAKVKKTDLDTPEKAYERTMRVL